MTVLHGSVRRLPPLLVVLVLGLLAPAVPATADSPPTLIPECAVAATLVEDGRPQDAVALIEEVRETGDRSACAGELDEASSAAGEARALLDEATRRAQDRDWAGAQAWAESALEKDSGLTGAQALLDRAKARQLTGANPLSYVADAWATWLGGSGKQLAELLSSAVLVGAIILVLARLSLLLPWSDRRDRWSRTTHLRNSKLRWFLLLAAALLTPVLTPFAFTRTTESPALWLAVVVTLLLVIVLVSAIAATAAWLYQRQRVTIQCFTSGKADEGEAKAADIVTHLRQLGAAPPRGLQMPIGADVDALKGSNITEGGWPTWLGKLVTLLQNALSVTPWRVRVDFGEGEGDDSETTVVISRHGRTIASTRVKHTPVGADGPSVEPAKLVAAFTLMVLSKAYGGFDGLNGATSWRSVGLQYAASDEPDRARKLRLLGKACDLDPRNRAAHYSFRMAKYRKSTDARELELARDWMKRLADDVQGPDGSTWDPIAARAIYAAMVFDRNYQATPVDPDEHSQLSGGALAERLEQTLGACPERQSPLYGQLRQALEVLEAEPGKVQDRLADSRRTPRASYTLACSAAQATPVDNDLVIRLLREAFVDPERKEWAPKDPELQAFVTTDEYREAFPEEEPAFLEAEHLKPYAKRLEAGGWDSPVALRAANPEALASALGITVFAARTLIRSAESDPVAQPAGEET